MEIIQAKMDKYMTTIKSLEELIALYLRREKIGPKLLAVQQKAQDVHKLMQEFQPIFVVQQQKYNALMEHMRKQQLRIINHLLQMHKKKKSENEQLIVPLANSFSNAAKTPRGGITSALRLTVPSSEIQNNGETPKMLLSDYQQSPFVRKVRPIAFQFLDFEVKISTEMFESIPKYMRGRQTIDELNSFLETVIIPCFNEKYQLLHRHRESIRNRVDLDLWKIFKDQASYVPGQNFITQGDISRRTKKLLDKKSQSQITMLRHIGVLQELRKSQTVCYVWIAN